MVKSVERRLTELEAQVLALRSAMAYIIGQAYHSDAELTRDRDAICILLEAEFRDGVTPNRHDVLQLALGEVEEILAPRHPSPGAEPREEANRT
jgi:hypothetical protein